MNEAAAETSTAETIQLEAPESVIDSGTSQPKDRRPITEADREIVRSGLSQNKGVKTIARELGRSHSTVSRLVARLSAPPVRQGKVFNAHKPKQSWSKVRRDDLDANLIHKLYHQDKQSKSAIARRFGTSLTPISRILGQDNRPRVGKPPVKKRQLSPEGRARISRTQKARWAKTNADKATAAPTPTDGVILTKDVRMRGGFYHCPDLLPDGSKCKVKHVNLRFLGRHRTTHGILGASTSAHTRMKAKQKLGSQPSNGKEHTNGNSIANTLATQPLPPNGKTRKPEGWTDEAYSGFLFAHLDHALTNVSNGNSDSRATIAKRIREFLQIEEHGSSQGEEGVRHPSGMPAMR